jgi:hypothetical protein
VTLVPSGRHYRERAYTNTARALQKLSASCLARSRWLSELGNVDAGPSPVQAAGGPRRQEVLPLATRRLAFRSPSAHSRRPRRYRLPIPGVWCVGRRKLHKYLRSIPLTEKSDPFHCGLSVSFHGCLLTKQTFTVFLFLLSRYYEKCCFDFFINYV